MAQLHFDASSLIHHPYNRMTGVERVSYELGERLVALGAKLVWFDPKVSAFRSFTPALQALFAELEKIDLDTLLSAPPYRLGRYAFSRRAAMLAATLYPQMPRLLGIHWHTERFALSRFVAAFDGMSHEERYKFARKLGLLTETSLQRKLAIQLKKLQWQEAIGTPITFVSGDVYLSTNVSSSDKLRQHLRRAIKRCGLKYVHMFHDLIPLRHPEFITGSHHASEFRRFAHDVIGMASVLTANSRFVARDVERYCAESGLPIHSVIPVQLPSGVLPATATLTSRLEELTRVSGAFALMVGTFQPRKNQKWLFNLWQDVTKKMGERAPSLVFAGQLGWAYEDTLKEMQRDAALWGRKIFFLEAPSDEELAWLYENCKFTLAPSLYEGWGLPIGEALAYGKYCLASDNTAVPEAGGGLAFTAPLDERDRWLAEIEKISLDPAYLRSQTETISRAASSRRTWDDVAREMLHICTSSTAIEARGYLSVDAMRIGG